MKLNLKYLAAFGLAVSFGHSAFAQTDYTWNGGGDKVTWSQAANWAGGVVPLTNGTTHAIYVESGYPAASTTPVVIAATDRIILSDALFSPTWGETLNIRGSVSAGFGMFTWGDNFTGPSTVNVSTNASLTCSDTIAFGTAWWFPGGPNVVMNVYSNAFVGVNYFQFGGHLNLYGGIVSVTNALNTGTATTPVFSGGNDTDATRAINLAGSGKLVLPVSYTATVNDWISRGILLVYGLPNDSAEIVIDESNTNYPGRTVVTTTSTGPNPILALRIQVPRTNLWVGGLELAQVFADYSVTTNVNVTAAAGIGIIYRSSNTNVATITTNGAVRATGLGSATLKAIIGTVSNNVAVTVTAYTNTTSLVHRYSFSEVSGTTAADSVGGVDWDGALMGGAAFSSGQVVLDGVNGHVQLPSGILTNLDAVTIEAWATFGSTIGTWGVLYTFGDSDGTFGRNYIACQPHTGGSSTQIGISDASPGFNHEQDAFFAPVQDGQTNLHIVGVYHPSAGYLAIYTNGVLANLNNNITIPLATALAADPLNYIGRSLYNADPYFSVSVNEFRIYNGPVPAAQIKADTALGPNQLFGTSTNTSLSISRIGGNTVVVWPTTSALVTLLASPTLGSGAVWTPVNTALSVVGSNYQMTVPASGSTQFFRLQK